MCGIGGFSRTHEHCCVGLGSRRHTKLPQLPPGAVTALRTAADPPTHPPPPHPAAAGRRARTEGLGLDAVGVAMRTNGSVIVDSWSTSFFLVAARAVRDRVF